jgi:hypothetical protein
MAGKRGRPKKTESKVKDNWDKTEEKEFINKKLGSIADLQDEITSMLDEINTLPEDLIPPKDLLPGLDFEYTKYDYEKDIEMIKEDAKETLECLSSLYLSMEQMKKKNVMSIIKNDAETISDIKFSLSCAKRGLVNCMKQIDAGANDPEMHVAVNAYQKEIRDSAKMINDLQAKMKSFYKELRDEYTHKEINEQQKVDEQKEQQQLTEKKDDVQIFDQRKMNKIIEELQKDPTLLKNLDIFGENKKD